MLNKVVVQSPAKLNLHLRVHPKRDDGYHDIESIFQAIDFFDDLIVTRTTEKVGCVIKTLLINLPSDNTLTVAYKEFCAHTGITEGIHVELTKRIFSGAGLGGGSSNGAYLIKALDTLFETKLSTEEKLQIALKVGSDVPFFINGGTSIVSGRGEIIRQIESRDDLYFVVIMPNVHSSTKVAFKCFDEYYEDVKTPQCLTLAEIEDVYRKPVSNWVFINSFTDLLVKQYPLIGKALEALNKSGATYSQLSGSGAAVYGVFNSEGEAKKAYTTLSVGWTCVLARAYSKKH